MPEKEIITEPQSFGDAAQGATARAEIAPKMRFVDTAPHSKKECPGDHPNCEWERFALEFAEREPRVVTHKDNLIKAPKDAPADWTPPETFSYAVNVVLLNPNKGFEPLETRSLMLPRDQNHSLTNAIMRIFRDNGKNLNGSRVWVIVHGYNHKKYGDGTKGYRVTVIPSQEAKDALPESRA